jgi:hypothetical protein
MLRLPQFLYNRLKDTGVVFSLTHRPPFTLGRFLVRSCVRGWVDLMAIIIIAGTTVLCEPWPSSWFLNNFIFTVWGCQPHAQPPTWRIGVSLFQSLPVNTLPLPQGHTTGKLREMYWKTNVYLFILKIDRNIFCHMIFLKNYARDESRNACRFSSKVHILIDFNQKWNFLTHFPKLPQYIFHEALLSCSGIVRMSRCADDLILRGEWADVC